MKIIFKPEPPWGSTRKREGFLLFPKTIQKQLRWLEYAKWEQRYKIIDGDGALGWRNTRWLN